MNEQDIRQFFAAVTAGDADTLAAGLTDDAVFVFPGERFGSRFEGKESVLKFFAANRRLFQDGMSFDISWIGFSGDKAVVEWRSSGLTHDGIDYSNRGVTVVTLRDGLLCDIQDYVDTEKLSATWPREDGA